MQDEIVEPPGSHEPTEHAKTPKKAAASGWIGSALEYYDFFIYGTAAALIFPKIFFPTGNAAAATIASLPPSGWPTWPGRAAPSSWVTSVTPSAARPSCSSPCSGWAWRPS